MNRNLLLIILHHLALLVGIAVYGFNIWIAIPIFFLSMMWAKLVGSDIMHFYFSHGEYKDSIKSYFYTFLTICTGLGSPISVLITDNITSIAILKKTRTLLHTLAGSEYIFLCSLHKKYHLG